jgi:hypothetical protein
MKTPICLNNKRNESSPNVRLVYDHVFFWIAIIVACVIIINVIYTISMQVELAMMMSIKV